MLSNEIVNKFKIKKIKNKKNAYKPFTLEHLFKLKNNNNNNN